MKRHRKLLVVFVVLAFGTLLALDLLRHPGPSDLKGEFKEIAFVRNEQNKAGIIRIYAFRVSDTTGADYLGCGDLLPHNDYGSLTKAFFFDADGPAPETIRLEPPHFDTTRYDPVAVYTKGKDKVGRVKISPRPLSAPK